MTPGSEPVHVLIGSYTERLGHSVGGGPGVMLVRVDADGRLSPVGEPVMVRNASYVSVNAAGDRAYASSEIVDFNGTDDGCVTVLEVDAKNGSLRTLQQVGSQGVGPAWTRPTADGRYLLTANYLAGNAVVSALGVDGRVGEPTAILPHVGTGPDASRQEGPHPHAALTSPDGRWLYVVDLGIDEVVGYQLDADGRAKRVDAAGATLPAGTGPRHAVWSRDGNFMYVDLELSSEIAVLRYQAEDGGLWVEQVISSLASPDMHAGQASHPSEIAVSPDGKYVVVGNRGPDVLSSFAVDEASGKLSPIADTPTGKTPRNFAFCGPSLVVLAEQDAHRLTSFHFDADTGILEPTGQRLDVMSPCFVCPLPG
ncbi:lactonase family protein [Algisphaera agarilytica]|uniref:lactonase family protein n=1 Tax=Algisphaera agarilytica TaxID=1385975 RepID=UPI001C872676|nr:lactonase family protein [Algisphaera agarilytica]